MTTNDHAAPFIVLRIKKRKYKIYQVQKTTPDTIGLAKNTNNTGKQRKNAHPPPERYICMLFERVYVLYCRQIINIFRNHLVTVLLHSSTECRRSPACACFLFLAFLCCRNIGRIGATLPALCARVPVHGSLCKGSRERMNHVQQAESKRTFSRAAEGLLTANGACTTKSAAYTPNKLNVKRPYIFFFPKIIVSRAKSTVYATRICRGKGRGASSRLVKSGTSLRR